MGARSAAVMPVGREFSASRSARWDWVRMSAARMKVESAPARPPIHQRWPPVWGRSRPGSVRVGGVGRAETGGWGAGVKGEGEGVATGVCQPAKSTSSAVRHSWDARAGARSETGPVMRRRISASSTKSRLSVRPFAAASGLRKIGSGESCMGIMG